MKKSIKKKQKEKLQKTSGITLVALVITIIVLLILAGVSIATLAGDNGVLKMATKAKEATAQAEQEEKEILDDIASYVDDQEVFKPSKGVNVPKLTEGMIPIKYVGEDWVITNENDPDWYEYIEDKKWANVMLSDGTYKTSLKNYNTDGTTIVKDGTNGTTNELGSMFVWIPRFAYSINEYKTAKDGTEGNTANITKVTFLRGTGRQDKEGKVHEKDYDIDSVENGKETPSIVHPAFSFGETNLSGIWVAKFEASMEEENTNSYTNNNVTDKTVKIVPNAESWRYIKVGNIFTNCLNMKANSIYGLNNTADSHLMKNSEWGAVAYLSASQYGIIPTKNNSGTKYGTVDNVDQYHSYTAAGDYKTNKSQSTTGNETGIYDLNGGAWEYVAAYYDNGNSNLSGQGTATYFKNNVLQSGYEKYWDKYEVGSIEKEKSKNSTFWNSGVESNKERMQITDERYNLMKNIKGDAMYEVINTYSYYGKKQDGNYDWGRNESFTGAEYGRSYYNQDYVLIGNCLQPFLLRGGVWWSGAVAGVFASYGSHGNAYYSYRFSSSLGALAL